MAIFYVVACLWASLLGTHSTGICEDDALDGCLARLSEVGLPMFGTTREFVQTCGDENPPLRYMSKPPDLPPGRTQKLLQAGLPHPADVALRTMSAAFETFRDHTDRLWHLMVRYAYGCFATDDCSLHVNMRPTVRDLHAKFLASMGSLVTTVA